MAGINPTTGVTQGLTPLDKASTTLRDTYRKLASGIQVGQARDNAANLAVISRFTSQVEGMNQAVRNANDGISMTQVADAGLQDIEAGTQRLQELAIQSANGTLTDQDRQSIQAEAAQIQAQISDTISNTEFNGTRLLASNQTVSLQTGPNAGDQTGIDLQDLSGALANVDLSTRAGAESALIDLNNNSSVISDARAGMGAAEARLGSVVSNLENTSGALTEARSRIQDTDFAESAAKLAATAIRAQAGVAIQIQANLSASRVEGLL